MFWTKEKVWNTVKIIKKDRLQKAASIISSAVTC